MNILYNLEKYKYHYQKFGWEGVKFINRRRKQKNQQIQIALEGIKSPVVLRNNTTDIPAFYHVFSKEEYEMEYGKNPEVIIDCGANAGLVSLFYKRKFPHAQIIAVEPEPSNFELLSQNTSAYDDIHCINYGIWNKPAILEIKDLGLGKWGFMTEEVEEENEHTIKAISIDEIMRRFNLTKIDILKVDIEGSEKEMFEKNYEKWLPFVKVLVIELHDNMRPGGAASLFKALSHFEFEFRIHGHNIAIHMKQV